MQARDILAATEEQPLWTDDDGTASFWKLSEFSGGMAWVGRYTGESPWERHPDGDEVLHVLEGEVEVTVLTDSETKRTTMKAGEMFIVPRGLWHKQRAHAEVTQWGATPGETEHSMHEDPRKD